MVRDGSVGIVEFEGLPVSEPQLEDQGGPGEKSGPLTPNAKARQNRAPGT